MQINKQAEQENKPMRATQEQFIKHFNKKGEKMISAPDIYRTAKEENKGLIESFQEDFEDILITSSRIVYNSKDLNAEVIHDTDSTIVTPKKTTIKVPVLRGDFKEDAETEAYLQVLFDTKDSIADILKVLKRLGKDKEVRLWAPSQSSRADKQIRCVGLYFVVDWFGVCGDDWFDDNSGFSRGVNVVSPQTATKGGKSK